MKVPKQFISRKQGKEKRLEDLAKNEGYFSSLKALAIAVNCLGFGGGYEGELLIWKPDMESPVIVARRESTITSLCLHNNLLYDAGYYRDVYDTLNRRVIASRNSAIMALCSHNGELYDANKKVYHTRSGEVLNDKRTSWVMALCSFNGELYDGGAYPLIYKTMTNRPFRARKDWTYVICSHENELYDGGSDNKVHNTTQDKVIARRLGMVSALCSFENNLYDAGCYYSINQTQKGYLQNFLHKNKLLNFKHMEGFREIKSLQPIPLWLADELLERYAEI